MDSLGRRRPWSRLGHLREDGGVELWIGLDAEDFAARAGSFLSARPERNVLATVLGGIREGHVREAIFAVASDADGATVGAALRTPPHPLLVTGTIAEPEAFLEAWMGLDPRVPGVSGERGLARLVAAAWNAQGGRHAEVVLHEALYLLEQEVAPAVPAPGRLRRAEWRDRAPLEAWSIQFRIDAGLANPRGAAAVYTPAERRGHGYATAATAALSQRLLDGGAERCMLYTDVANPVSNHIYAKLGYVRVTDWEEHAFPTGEVL